MARSFGGVSPCLVCFDVLSWCDLQTCVCDILIIVMSVTNVLLFLVMTRCVNSAIVFLAVCAVLGGILRKSNLIFCVPTLNACADLKREPADIWAVRLSGSRAAVNVTLRIVGLFPSTCCASPVGRGVPLLLFGPPVGLATGFRMFGQSYLDLLAMSDPSPALKDVDECGTGKSCHEFKISEEEVRLEVPGVNRVRLDDLWEAGRLPVVISVKADVVKAIQDAYRLSFRLLQSVWLENDPVLIELRALLCRQMAELAVIQSWMD